MSNKVKYILIFVGFVILTVTGYILSPKTEELISFENKNSEDDYIFVHIEGEVNEPGLKKVKYGTRLHELIEEAGGATEEADLSRINLSVILNDEQKVNIPTKITQSLDMESGLILSPININTAPKEKLMTLDGIGEGTAEKIIKYRQNEGYFNDIEELKNVPGIGESKYNAIKDNITI